MIFNVPGHIGMIKNGLFWYEGIDKPDWSLKELKNYHVHRAQFLADRPDISKEVKEGLHPLIIKIETRRISRGIYQIEAERKKPHYRGYAVQRKRGVPAEPDIRIIFEKIWQEVCVTTDKLGHGGCLDPIPISRESAFAEGGYAPEHYEKVFRDLNPKWNGISRWAFKFHVEVRK